MNRKIQIFSSLKWIAASMVLALFSSSCSRQMAMNGKTNQVRYVQTNDSRTNHDITKVNASNLSAVAPKLESQPVSPDQISPKQEKTTKSIAKHSFTTRRTAKTIQGETVNNSKTKTYAYNSHHSTVRNADIRTGGLISGIVLLILGCILYALPGPVGYILGTVVVIIAVIIIVFAII